MTDQRVVVIGAGMGGLACAARLAAVGCAVSVIERGATPGGKLRTLAAAGLHIDSGPTVLTMRWVFEELFAACNATLADHLQLHPLPILARHAWRDGARLDLFADPAASEHAIGDFAGAAAAAGYRSFRTQARRTYEALEHSFIRADRPTMLGLARVTGLAGITRIAPFRSLWNALGGYFPDPRLRQLFGRYATYCGASPMRAPATLMLVAHVESQGVWTVAGGMHHLAQAVAALAERHGAQLRYGETVAEIMTHHGRVAGVRLATGEAIAADAVVVNADAAALATGLFGAVAAAATRTNPTRSLSAVTYSIAGQATGFPLTHHNVFFSSDYQAEFTNIENFRLPVDPTIYVCAQDRDTQAAPLPPERLFCIINAPASADRRPLQPGEIAACATTMTSRLAASGLTLNPIETRTTTPADFSALFPATGGALYGPATHGPFASFRRPGARTSLPGLYLAGGSVHPGPGLPMAALSGHRAAIGVLADGASTRRSHQVATAGGMSTA